MDSACPFCIAGLRRQPHSHRDHCQQEHSKLFVPKTRLKSVISMTQKEHSGLFVMLGRWCSWSPTPIAAPPPELRRMPPPTLVSVAHARKGQRLSLMWGIPSFISQCALRKGTGIKVPLRTPLYFPLVQHPEGGRNVSPGMHGETAEPQGVQYLWLSF